MTEIWQSDVHALKRVLMKHVRDAFGTDLQVDNQWQELNYLGRPSLEGALREYEALTSLIQSFGTEILYLPAASGTGMDSLYARDAAIATARGMILCNMGKAARKGEPIAQKAFYEANGIPVLGVIEGTGSVEGGDVAWIDEHTLGIARGYRTNAEGIRQMRQLLGEEVELVEVDLPHFRGPSDVFHLMSIYSPIAPDAAIIYSPLMPVRFRELLVFRGVKLIEVPEEEYDTMGCNVLAMAPYKCITVEGSPITAERIRAAGGEVFPYAGKEISLKGCGGPTCLTRPLSRTV